MPMLVETGRLLRRLAYMIEAVCMIGLLSIARGRVDLKPVAGFDQRQWLSAGLALGISLWVIGTAIVYWPREKPGEPR